MGQITTVKCVELRLPPCEPVYLCWKNSAGGWSYWMFEYKQLIQDNTQKGDLFERYVEDLEEATGTYSSLARFADRRITIEAPRLTRVQYEAIKEINTSPKIYQMFESDNGSNLNINRFSDNTPKRIELVSVSTENAYFTNSKLINATFTLQYPRIFTQNLL